MSFADAFIADLDGMIDSDGEWIRLQRLTIGPDGAAIPFEARMKAIVRRGAPSDLVEPGGQETTVVASPTWLSRARFPGEPRRDDRVIIEADPNAPTAIAELKPVRVGGRLVRVTLACRG
jgi:hypothetical protein